MTEQQFLPMMDDDDLADDEELTNYAAQVSELVAQALGNNRPVYRELYNYGPSFAELSEILVTGFQSTDQGTSTTADTAFNAIDHGIAAQQGRSDLKIQNAFYEEAGWRKEFGAMDARDVAPTIVSTDDSMHTDDIVGALRTGREQAWGQDYEHTNQAGSFTKQAVLRGARAYTGQRGSEVLSQISRVLYNYMVAKAQEVTEIQALCVAGRLVVCANESVAANFFELFKSDKADTLLKIIQKVSGDKDTYAYRPPSMAGKSGDTLTNYHEKSLESLNKLTGDSRERLDYLLGEGSEGGEEGERAALQQAYDIIHASKQWKTGSYSEALAWLQDGETAQGVFWMNPPDLGACHAEGALVALLARSGITAPAVIAGTMRACTGCYLTLRFAKERLGLSLVSAPKYPGGFWETTQAGGMLSLIQAYCEQQLVQLPMYKDADERGQAEIRQAFRYQGVQTFCDFVARNFPLQNYATNMAGPDEGVVPRKLPNVAMRRTATLNQSQLPKFFEAALKKNSRKRKNDDDDGDFTLGSSDDDDRAKKPSKKKRKTSSSSSTRSKGSRGKKGEEEH